MPIHIAGAVAPSVAWGTKVSQRNAPGAISAIAFIVNPVNPRVACISTGLLSAMGETLSFLLVWTATRLARGATWLVLQSSGLPFVLPIDSFYWTDWPGRGQRPGARGQQKSGRAVSW